MGLISRLNESRRPLLQVALDFTSIEDMIKIVDRIKSLPIDIFEAGTPLIKAEGIKSISILRALVGPEKLILADMKTADVGGLEVKLAYDAGADISTVLAFSDDEVIESALKKGKELGTEVVVDTLGIKNVEKRVEELIDLGVNFINLHVGIDVQKTRGLRAGNIASKYSYLVKKFEAHFSISGGIRVEDIPKIWDSGFEIIVVGSAITKSPNPEKSAEAFISELESLT